jgi:hypothetical protein
MSRKNEVQFLGLSECAKAERVEKRGEVDVISD